MTLINVSTDAVTTSTVFDGTSFHVSTKMVVCASYSSYMTFILYAYNMYTHMYHIHDTYTCVHVLHICIYVYHM